MRRIIERIYGSIVFPFQQKREFGKLYNNIYKQLINDENLTEGELKEKQQTRLKKLLTFASKNNAYYSKYEINPEEDIEKTIQALPVLNKKDIKNIPPSSNLTSKHIYKHITSGSTGNPVQVNIDEYGEANRRAAFQRFLNWHNLKIYNKNVLVWGKIKGNETKKRTLKKLKTHLFPTTYPINVFKLNSEIQNIYNSLIKFKPSFIRGYKSGILQLCQLFEKYNMDGTRIGMKKAITTSEILFPEERKYIEKILNTEVIDEYGAAETGLIAVECPFKQKHIITDQIYFFKNEKGEIIITELNNYLSPIINYNLGDRIVLENYNKCSCGLKFPVIKRIEGRQGDQIIKPSGEEVSQYVIYYAAKELDMKGMKGAIEQYKVIQKDNKTFIFYYTKGDNFSKDAIKYMEKRMKEEIGESIYISFKHVDQIPKDKSGKIRFFQGINK